jgi:hypothetical protein
MKFPTRELTSQTSRDARPTRAAWLTNDPELHPGSRKAREAVLIDEVPPDGHGVAAGGAGPRPSRRGAARRRLAWGGGRVVGARGAGGESVLPSKTLTGLAPDRRAEAGRARLTYPEIKRVWDANGSLGEITFNSRTAVVPLQAADIMAYETFKLVKNLSEGAPRETRKLGARLYQESLQFGVSHYDRDNLALLVAAFIANGHIQPPDAA